MIRIQLEPVGQSIEVEPGTPLRDVLFAYGVEFPCGGRGHCRKCRVRVLSGRVPPTEADRSVFNEDELAEGWRLTCRILPETDLVLEVGQWQAVILADESPFVFTPSEGFGIAVDVGTTTLVAQLVDLETGHVLGLESRLNPQLRYGADVMSRIEYALQPGGLEELCSILRQAVGSMVERLTSLLADPSRLHHVVLVGNTVMHHLFCHLSPEPLSHYPFQPEDLELKTFAPAQLGWSIPNAALVQFLPCVGGFVGSDILAGILATGLDRTTQIQALIDLGTNGEIVLGSSTRILCASTAAGPAFEGGRISYGMRAATGAIAGARVENGQLRLEVLGGTAPRGICGSGLVDLVAVGLQLGWIRPDGRFAGPRKDWELHSAVKLTQRDVRELQLAKAAVAAGFQVLLRRLGLGPDQVARLYLAGAFGNYVNPSSARAIGLLDLPPEGIVHAGNTALTGAKIALFLSPEDRRFTALRMRVEHVALGGDPSFEELFVAEMSFPIQDRLR